MGPIPRRAALPAILALAACASEISDPDPAMLVIPAPDVSIPLGVDTASVVLRNDGGTALEWEMSAALTWFTFEPGAGTIAPRDSVRVVVRADRMPMPPWEHQVPVTVRTSAFYADRSITVTVTALPDPRVTVFAADTVIEFPERQGWFDLRNGGKGTLHWSVSADVSWVSFDWQSSGALYEGYERRVNFYVDRTRLPADTTATITILSNDTTGPRTLRVLFSGTPEREVLPLPFAAPLAVQLGPDYVALAGDALARLHTGTGQLERTALPGAARALTPAGSDAAVATHAGGFTNLYGSFSATTHEPGPVVAWRTLSYAPLVATEAVLVSHDNLGNVTEEHLETAPIEHLVANGYAAYGSTADGLIRFPSYVPGDRRLLIGGIPFAAEQRRIWSTERGLVTSSGAVVSVGIALEDHAVIGQLPWPGSGPARAIRSLGTTPVGTRWFVVHDSLGDSPAPPVVWEYDDAFSATPLHLSPVVVNGVEVPVEPFAAFYAREYRRLLVVQRALTPGGGGPWSVLMLRR